MKLMNFWIILNFLFTLSLFTLNSNECGALELTDATKTKITIRKEPKRIVTLAPSLGELVADLLDENMNRLVGVSDFTDYPPSLQKIESVGPYSGFNIEKVASLKPDLVIGTKDGNPKDKVLFLRELGITVLVVSTENFNEIDDSIKLVSTALGKKEKGNQLVRQLRSGINRIHSRSKNKNKYRVLLQINGDPLIVVGKRSFLNEALKTVGAENIYGDLNKRYPKISIEDVVNKNPDVILILALGHNLKLFQKHAINWKRFKNIKAVKNNRIHVVSGDELLRPSIRLLEGLAILERTLYQGL